MKNKIPYANNQTVVRLFTQRCGGHILEGHCTELL